jgi:orotate phosphoribosyltransferase
MEEELVKLLQGRRGHFQMESGFHSEFWFELDQLFERPKELHPFVVELAKRLARHNIDAVCGPESGGAKLAGLIAKELDIAYFFTMRFERPNMTGLFPVSYRIPAALRENLRGKSIAVVDDAVSAGSAARGTYADLVSCGARPVALGALFVFGEDADNFAKEKGMALEVMARMKFGMWNPGNCPLCQAGVPFEKVSDVAL